MENTMNTTDKIKAINLNYIKNLIAMTKSFPPKFYVNGKRVSQSEAIDHALIMLEKVEEEIQKLIK